MNNIDGQTEAVLDQTAASFSPKLYMSAIDVSNIKFPHRFIRQGQKSVSQAVFRFENRWQYLRIL